MTFKIDKDVPLPGPSGKTPKYKWSEMEVGDSFFVPEDGSGTRLGAKMSSVASAQGSRHNRRYVTRTVEGGVRVWRTG